MLECARNNFPKKEFLNLNMLDLDKISGKKFSFIFFIASYHHLQTIEDRETVLKKAYNLLDT